jgi:hypothetical protein
MGSSGGTRRWALAAFTALLACVALLASAPGALAIVVPGKISGTVTEAGSKNPLPNMFVGVYEAHGKESPVEFELTGPTGEYTVEGLPEGEYKVEFSKGFEGQNFISQFYNDKPSRAAAESVMVVKEKTTTGIDAEMQVGGEIEGTVTDAVTHKTLGTAFVVVLGPGEVEEGEAITEANGHYTIAGLATGSYKIVFEDPGYLIQYYNNEPSLASANPVEVVQKSVKMGINAALMPTAPINTVAPAISGTPAVGQTLSCLNGSWTGIPAPTFTRVWLRDGVAIAGATASTYVVQATDQGNGLTCKVTAKNSTATVAALSNTLIVPVPPPPPPPSPSVELPVSKLMISGGVAKVPIVCAGSTCGGTIELSEQVTVKHRHGRKTKKTLVLGRASYALLAGHSATIAVRLTSAGKSALAKAKHHRLSAKLSASVIGGVTKSTSVVLSEPATKHRHGHGHR